MTRPPDAMDLLSTFSEEEFQEYLLTYAVMQDWLGYHSRNSRKSYFGKVLRMENPPGIGPPENPVLYTLKGGFPDLVLVRGETSSQRGRVIFAELKVGRNNLSYDQREWFRCLRNSGAEVYVWRPEAWNDIERILAR